MCKLKITYLLILLISSLAYAQVKQKDKTKQKKDSISVFERMNVLDEVVIQGKTFARQLKESPVAVEVIELDPVLNKSGSIIDVVTQVPGVNVRTDGGVGDPVNFVINGLDKKNIVLFKDGIPMSFYGHSFEPGHVSANMFERVEMYKGVLPLELGADALGGGINFITRKPKRKTIDISLEAGSFNTQRLAFNTFIPTKFGLYGSANLSYVLSDNNYEILKPKIKTEGFSKDMVKVPLVNNGINMYAGEYTIGVRNKKWAKDLHLSLINSWMYRRINRWHGYGDVFNTGGAKYAFTKEKALTGVLTYKNKMFDNKLFIDVTAGYGKTNVIAKDTSLVVSDRYNHITGIEKKPERPEDYYRYGENFGMDLSLDYTLKAFRGTIGVEVLPNQKLKANHTYTSVTRIGQDSIGGRAHSGYRGEEGKIIDIYKFPTLYLKSVSALGWEGKYFNDKLESILAYKHYRRRALGYGTFQSSPGNTEKIQRKSGKYNGWLAGLSYKPTDKWMFKLSYEHTLRVPDAMEVYGNSMFIRSNLALKPEESKNFNFEFQYRNLKKLGVGSYMVGSNVFYRRTIDVILLSSDLIWLFYVNAPVGIYVRGADIDFYYQPLNFFSLSGNVTYMDRQMASAEPVPVKQADGSVKMVEVLEERLTDISPLLGNLSLSFWKKDLFQKGSRLEFFWHWNYTHRYQTQNGINNMPSSSIGLFEDLPERDKGKDGFYNKGWVPNDGRKGQHIHSQGITYTLKKPNISLSLECKNVFDAVIYNNYLNQSPGRSYFAKVRWVFDRF